MQTLADCLSVSAKIPMGLASWEPSNFLIVVRGNWSSCYYYAFYYDIFYRCIYFHMSNVCKHISHIFTINSIRYITSHLREEKRISPNIKSLTETMPAGKQQDQGEEKMIMRKTRRVKAHSMRNRMMVTRSEFSPARLVTRDS